MKLCLGSNQDVRYLEYAHEIFFDFKDRQNIAIYAKKYENKTIILNCPILNIDWNEIQELDKICNHRFIVRITHIVNAIRCKELNIQYYFNFPITSYDELKTILEMGACYVRLGPPLFFDLNTIKKYYPQAKIRLVPNQAYADHYPRKTGIYGTWVRPEDLMLYDEYVETLDFEESDINREGALYRIYWQDRKWPGELELIIPDINHPAVNRVIVDGMTDARLNCRQMCQVNNNCHICYRALELADVEKLQAYKDAIEKKYEAIKDE